LGIVEFPALDQIGRDGGEDALLLEDGLADDAGRRGIEDGLGVYCRKKREQKREGN